MQTVWERRYILVKACRSRDLKQVEELTVKILGKSHLASANSRCKGPEAQ